MTRHRKLLYVVADGATARFVEHAATPGEFVTVQRIDGASQLAKVRVEQRGEAPGRSMESATSARHAVGREDAYRRAKDAFAAEVGDAATRMMAAKETEGVVLVAPSRLLKALGDHIQPREKVLRTLARDLTKVPDHELGRWLTAATPVGM